jgi:hypothetical protein
MSDDNFNPGILLGAARAMISVIAAIAALYLWAVKRAKRKFDKVEDPQARVVLPWLSPLLLPTVSILCLGFVAVLTKAYVRQSWPEASTLFTIAWPIFPILFFWLWLKAHKKM